MLSYQHAYHAGNFADVHKHAINQFVTDYLFNKESAITFYDTHGGRGWYQYDLAEMQKGKEFTEGFFKLKPCGIPFIDRYLAAVGHARFSEQGYPGSPLMTAKSLRPQDELHVAEMHPGEGEHLVRTLFRDEQAHVHKRNGYEMLKAIFPPNTPRACILIDPAYEVKSEYTDVTKSVAQVYKRWQKAVTIIWYPLLPAGDHKRLKQAIIELKLPKVVCSELTISEPEGDYGMYGSGMIVINAPYLLEQQADALNSLARQLSDAGEHRFENLS